MNHSPALALSFLAVLGACSRSNAPQPAAVNLSGDWAGMLTSSRGPSGGIGAHLTQVGGDVSGSVTPASGIGCRSDGGIFGSVSGLGVVLDAGLEPTGNARFTGTADSKGNSMSGSYTVAGGSCNGDSGTWYAYRVSPGTFVPGGIWFTSDGRSGTWWPVTPQHQARSGCARSAR